MQTQKQANLIQEIQPKLSFHSLFCLYEAGSTYLWPTNTNLYMVFKQYSESMRSVESWLIFSEEILGTC